MKFQVSSFKFQVIRPNRAAGKTFNLQPSTFNHASGFTLVEIAICLGIIGIALVAIIGILPRGLHTQKDSRQETIVGQDASILFEAVRNGSRGADDLTNYVYIISNSVTAFDGNGVAGATTVYGYAFNGSTINGVAQPPATGFPITNGLRIVGLLSQPQFWTNDPYDLTGQRQILLPNVYGGGYSNHVITLVRAISGVAAERPPQDNQILREDSFAYRVYVENAPVGLPTPPPWSPVNYGSNAHVYVFWNYGRWRATNSVTAADVPGVSPKWQLYDLFADNVGVNERELRMIFLWPLLPNGGTGLGRLTLRVPIGGQLAPTNGLYFYRPNIFSPAR